jgi:alpha-glucosidase
MLLLTLRGTPTLYQGDELGMENVEIPIEKQKDPFGLRVPGSGRDLCRTPMQWTSEANAGFTEEGIETWLPLSPLYKAENVRVEQKDAHSILNLYRKLLALRREAPALNRGSYTSTGETTDTCFSFLREAAEEKYLITLNFSGDEIHPHSGLSGTGKIQLSTRLDRTDLINFDTFILRPHEGLIVEL